MRVRVVLVVLASFLAAACSQQQRTTTAAPTPTQGALKNPTDFPLPPDASILDVRPFRQTVATSAGGNSAGSGLAAQGNGTYAGNEVLVVTPQSMPQLEAWLASLESSPPKSYTHQLVSGGVAERANAELKRYGIDYGVFRLEDPTRKRGVVVVVVDPKTVRGKLGIAIDLVNRYRSLPDALRKPIDDKLKASTGFSATEATDPSSPLGMTLNALGQVGSSDVRAVVVVDAAKQ